MNAQDLMEMLVQYGVRLEIQGDRICVDAPPGAITPALHEAMAEQKTDLINLLTPTATVHDDGVSRKHVSQGNGATETCLLHDTPVLPDNCPDWMKELADGLAARLPGVEMIFTPLDIPVEDGKDPGEADVSGEDRLVHM